VAVDLAASQRHVGSGGLIVIVGTTLRVVTRHLHVAPIFPRKRQSPLSTVLTPDRADLEFSYSTTEENHWYTQEVPSAAIS
jgi:hypothetical protein